MAEFAHNNFWQASKIMLPFETPLGYDLRMFYEDNQAPWLKAQAKDEEAAALYYLIKELKTNLAESQGLQTLYHTKHVKKSTYRPGESVWPGGKHAKTKKNRKLKHK